MTFIGSGPKPPGVAMGPIFEVTSDDGSIVVTDGTGPVVDLAATIQPFASIEMVVGMVMVAVPNGIWLQVPWNTLGPVEVLTQDLGAAAGIGIPEEKQKSIF